MKKRINTERLNVLLKSFYNSLSNESIPDESLHKVSYSLYSQLIDSTWQMKQISHLIIIPDERIAMVPFEVLNTSAEKAVPQKRNIHYLIRDHSVSYHYSAGLFYHSEKPPKEITEHKVFAFAPGNFGPQYNSLKWNIDEVSRITSMLDGQKFTGKQATELKLKTKNSDESVLHLATHCIINNNNPMMSYLLFAKDSLEKEDGKLYAHELFNMNLPHNLVALSACETGTGKLQSGEGLMAISRGFLYAGSPLILASLWAVYDKSTSDLMVYFYSYIKKGFPGHIALQKAKINFLDNQPVARLHPKYWSGFVLIGNASGFHKDHKDYTVYWLIFLCICIGCLAFFIRKRFV